jgi:hypothetical protein
MPMVVQELVELTQVHPLFQHLYIFPSYHKVSVHFFLGKQGGPQLSQFLFFCFISEIEELALQPHLVM